MVSYANRGNIYDRNGILLLVVEMILLDFLLFENK